MPRSEICKALEQVRAAESSRELKYLLRLASDTIRDGPNKAAPPTAEDVNLVAYAVKQTVTTSQIRITKTGPGYTAVIMALLNSGFVPVNLPLNSPTVNIPPADGALARFSKMFTGESKQAAPEPASAAASVQSTVSESNLSRTSHEASSADALSTAAPQQKVYDVIAHLLVTAVAPHMLILGEEHSVPCLLAMQAAMCPDNAVELSPFPDRKSGGTLPSPPALSVVPVHDPFVLRGELFLSFIKLLMSVATKSLLPCCTMAKQVLSQVVGKLSQHVEQEKLKDSTILKIRVLDTPLDLADGGTFDSTPLQADLISLLKFCVGLCTDVHPAPVNAGLSPLRTTETRALALSTILQVVVNGGPAFRRAPAVRCVLRHLIFPALLDTSLSNEPDVYRASLNIFLNVCISFRSVLLQEISTYFTHVLFRILDSKNTGIHQKILVLTVIQTIAEEPKNLIDIFLNYDCDAHSKNIYEDLVEHIAVLCNAGKDSVAPIPSQSGSPVGKQMDSSTSSLAPAQPTTSPISLLSPTPSELQQAAIGLFLTIANANVQWIDRFEDTSSSVDAVVGSNSNSTALGSEPSSSRTFSVSGDLDSMDSAPLSSPQTTTSTTDESSFVLHARRVKKAHERFFLLFNESKNSDSAVSYLCEHTYILPDLNEEFKTDVDTESSDAPMAATSSSKELDTALVNRIAAFLCMNEASLDKLVLGDYFSKAFRKENIRRIFVAWVRRHNFTDKSLDEALREFLGGFKLLGEAHVVDKTMELFADWYCQQNPNAFVSANTAFVLSFSICMLNTDAHSASVKEKMTKEGFIRNNRGIDDGKDVSEELLSEIYDRIAAREIKLRPSSRLCTNAVVPEKLSAASVVLGRIPLLKHLVPIAAAVGDAVMIPVDAAGNVLFNTAQRKKAQSYKDEFRAALREALDVISASRGTNSFIEASSVTHAIPMWEVTSDSLVRVLAAALSARCNAAQIESSGTTQSKVSMDVLLDGTKDVVKVCTAYGFMDHAAFLIELLFDLSQIHKVVKIKKPPLSGIVISCEVGDDSIACIVTLLEIFAERGDSLPSYLWVFAYTIISVLDAVANGVENSWRKYKPAESQQVPNDSGGSMFNLFSWNGAQDKGSRPPNVDDTSFAFRNDILEKLRLRGDPGMWVERLFDATSHSPQGQVQMANALAKVCEKELLVGRVFCLSRLVEFVNICVQHSTRMLWRDLWSNASSVFIEAGQLAPPLCSAAIDGLKGIAFAYLARGELSKFKFQRDVLRLFEVVLMRNGSEAVRIQILQAMSEIVELRAGQLSSGWTVILSSLSRMAVHPTLSSRSWQICEAIMQRHVTKLSDCFSDFIFCLTSFSCNNTNEPEAILSASFLLACASWMHRGLRNVHNIVLTPAGVRRWVDTPLDNEIDGDTFGHEFSRVAQALTPISESNLLVKATGEQRSQYHLWLSLFEGLVPIVLVHPSIRVRCHVVSTVWDIIGRYSRWFDESVLNSIFSSMITPALASIFNDSSLATAITVNVCKMRLLLHCFLRSMIIAAGRPGNEELAARCAALLSHAATMATQSRHHVANLLPLTVLDAVLQFQNDRVKEKVLESDGPVPLAYVVSVEQCVPQWTELHHLTDAVFVPSSTAWAVSEAVLQSLTNVLLPSLLRVTPLCDQLHAVTALTSALRVASLLAVSRLPFREEANLWIPAVIDAALSTSVQGREMMLTNRAVALVEGCCYVVVNELATASAQDETLLDPSSRQSTISEQSRSLLATIIQSRQSCLDECRGRPGSSFHQAFPLSQLHLRDGLESDSVTVGQWRYLSMITVLRTLLQRPQGGNHAFGRCWKTGDVVPMFAALPSELEEGTAQTFLFEAREIIFGDAAVSWDAKAMLTMPAAVTFLQQKVAK
jgi:hypothetical protein